MFIRFSVADFEYTTALTVFDLFRIPIFHGWVVDPQNADLVKVLNNQTYNQVVEMIIDYKTSMDSERVHKGEYHIYFALAMLSISIEH